MAGGMLAEGACMVRGLNSRGGACMAGGVHGRGVHVWHGVHEKWQLTSRQHASY